MVPYGILSLVFLDVYCAVLFHMVFYHKSFDLFLFCLYFLFFFQYKKSPLQTIGEEQTQNPYTELLVLKAHHDIVRFLVQLDEYR